MKQNYSSSGKVARRGDAPLRQMFYPARMARISVDWYLRDWLATLRVSQQALADRLDWQKSKVSRLTSGTSVWRRDHLADISWALHLQPYELLLHPDDAMAIRRMRESALTIAADARHSWHDERDSPPLPSSRTAS